MDLTGSIKRAQNFGTFEFGRTEVKLLGHQMSKERIEQFYDCAETIVIAKNVNTLCQL